MPMPNDNTQDEFLAAFNEDAAPAPEMSEDEAFGLSMPEDGTSDPAQNESVMVTGADETGAESGQGMNMPAEGEAPVDAEAPTDSPVADAAAAAEGASEGEDMGGDDEPTDPKELQRKKSWEGRLRAKERELAAREAALNGGKPAAGEEAPAAGEGAPADKQEAASEAIEQAADQLEADGDAAGAQAVSEVAEKVESGEMTPEQAMRMLADDFGEDFVKPLSILIKHAAASVADEKVSRLDGTINKMISEITDERARTHFETIADAHPDFNSIPQDKVESYLATLPEDERAEAEQVITKGSARQVIKFLNGMKAWDKNQSATDQEEAPASAGARERAMDDAEGVRSSGLRLPEAPARADDYAAAWDQF